MARPILKLPAKPAAAADDSRSSRRKPVRAGARTARLSAPLAVGGAAAPAPAAGRPFSELVRLSKRLSELGLCSRREADEWIENGWISVDGVVVSRLGVRVRPEAKIVVDTEARKHQGERVTLLYNAPLAVAPGPGGENPSSPIRRESRWVEDDSGVDFKAAHLRRLVAVAEPDAGATGMVVFTQDSGVARRLADDDVNLEQEYLVRVEGDLDADGLKLLNHGLMLDGAELKRAQVSWQNERQLRMVLHEHREQQIRRMCELVGLRVGAIKRIRIGSVSLGKVPPGQWRYLRQNERF